MSKQVNFFADAIDRAALHAAIWEVFGGGLRVSLIRDTHADVRPVSASMRELDDARETVGLIPRWGEKKLQFEAIDEEGHLFLNVRKSPVIEYRPSRFEAGGEVLQVGRLYWAYEAGDDPWSSAVVDKLFRWVRRHTELLPGTRVFRIFPSAGKNARLLRFWGGEAVLNALFEKATVGR